MGQCGTVEAQPRELVIAGSHNGALLSRRRTFSARRCMLCSLAHPLVHSNPHLDRCSASEAGHELHCWRSRLSTAGAGTRSQVSLSAPLRASLAQAVNADHCASPKRLQRRWSRIIAAARAACSGHDTRRAARGTRAAREAHAAQGRREHLAIRPQLSLVPTVNVTRARVTALTRGKRTHTSARRAPG